METVTKNGITYKPTSDDAALTYDSDSNVTGISSGTVEVTLENSTDPKITLDGSTAFSFTAESTDGTLRIVKDSHSFNYVSGKATYSADKINFPAGNVGVRLSNAIFSSILGTITVKIPSGGLDVPFNSSGATVFNLTDTLTATVSGGTATGSISLSGQITYNAENKAITLAKDATISVNDLKVIEDATALNFAITANSDSTLAIDGLYFVFKDGASVNIKGSTFGLSGDVTLSGGDLSFGLLYLLTGQVSEFTLSAGATLTTTLQGLPLSITAPNDSSASISMTDGVFSVTTYDTNGINLYFGNLSALPINIKGTVKLDVANSAITFTKDTVAKVTLPSGTVAQITANDEATSKFEIASDGTITLTPNEGDGTLNFKLLKSKSSSKRLLAASSDDSDYETTLDADIEVVSGSISFNLSTFHFDIAAGTVTKLTMGDYVFTTSNSKNAGGTISFTDEGGITYTPDSDDGGLTITVEGTGDSQFENVALEALNGSFTLNADSTFSIAKDTELKLTFSDTYSISFKTTDEAGGTLALLENGITFTPGDDDGHLELTVTNGDTTRTASLEMTGTVTYTFGGNIELAEGTVVTNTFEDGNELTITANTDSSGTITFNPEGGLTITPSSTDSLNVVLTDGEIEIFNITYITGSITYSGGTVTASDGSEIRFTNYFFDENEMIMSTNGGESSIKFGADGTSYIASENAQFVLDYQDGETLELKNGTFTDNYDNTATITAGSVFKTNDDDPIYILKTAGTYTLNGNEITTTKDGVEVSLTDGDTVSFDAGAGIIFDGREISGSGIISITKGEISGDIVLGGSFINNSLDAVKITGTDDGDTISNIGNNVTIESGAGNDSIGVLIAENVSINTGEGNNTVYGVESKQINITTGDGDNFIYNIYVKYDEEKQVYVNYDSDTASTIITGAGNDTIANEGMYQSSVNAGEGDNVIGLYHSYENTVTSGAGNDSVIVAKGYKANISTGAGNDTIIGEIAGLETSDWAFGSNNTVDAGAGDDYIDTWYSDNSSLYGGAGNDTIINNGANTTINGGAGNDYIELTNKRKTETGDYEAAVIVASAGNDTIKNYSSVVTLQGDFITSGAIGNDVVLRTSSGTLTVLDGAGKTLNINGEESVIGGDNDTIGAAFAEFMLKRTEKGYPAVCDSGLFEPDTKGFDPPDAYLTENWTIESADHLKLCGTHYGPKNPTGQWIILVTGYGQVGATMNIHAAALLAMDYDVLVVEPRASGNSEGDWLTMGVAECVDVALWTQKIAETNSNAQITLFGISMGAATVIMAAALSQTTNVTSLVEDCSYANIYSIFKNIASHFVESFGWTGTTEELFDKVADASKFLTGYNVADALPIDSIGKVTVPSMFIHGTADTIVPVEDVQKLYDASGATIKELWTVEGGVHGKSVLKDPFSYLAKAVTLLSAANEEIGASIKNSTAEQFIRGTIYEDTIRSSAANVTIEAVAGNDYISLSSAAKNNTIYAGEGDDTIIGGGGNNLFVYAGGNDFINGYKTTDTIQISSGEITKDTVSGSNVIFTVGEDNITLKGAKNKTINIIDAEGKSFSTLISGIYTEVTLTDADQSPYKADRNAVLIDASSRTEDIQITGNSKDNSINGGAGNDTLNGGGGDDYIVGYEGADLINGGSGDDIILGNEGADTLSGGSGNDRIFGDDGEDSIKGGSGNDYISGGDANDSLFGDAGNDTIFGNNGADYIEGGAGNDSLLGNEDNDSIIGGAGADYLDGGAGADYLEGGAGADLIEGGAGTDTLNGGASNDTLTGGDGNDLFVYSAGKDIVTDYTAGEDKIEISKGKISKTTYSGNDVIFKIGGGTLTVKDGNGKAITIIDSSGNETTKTYNKSEQIHWGSRTLDLLYDNNFMTDDATLDDITEAKYSVTDIQNNKVEEFAQDSSILAYSEDK